MRVVLDSVGLLRAMVLRADSMKAATAREIQSVMGEVLVGSYWGLFEDGLFVGPEFFDSVDEGGGVWEGCATGNEEVDEAGVVVEADVFTADSWGGAEGLFVGACLGLC